MAGGFTSQEFIGRAAELDRLKVVLDRAEQGRPQLVLLAGEAGVGKSRLLLEFSDRAQQRGARVLAGGCVELGDIGLAYLPVVDALRGLADDPAVRCRSCGRCGCGAPGPATRVCAGCRLEKGKAQFRTATSTICRDCE
jgi:hypothetical protein